MIATLPCLEEAESRPAFAATSTAPAGVPPRVGARRSLRVLVVDDEPLIGALFREFLLGDGHTVKVAKSGPAALKNIRAQAFDLVITDQAMAQMSGLELATEVQKLRPPDSSRACDRMPGAGRPGDGQFRPGQTDFARRFSRRDQSVHAQLEPPRMLFFRKKIAAAPAPASPPPASVIMPLVKEWIPLSDAQRVASRAAAGSGAVFAAGRIAHRRACYGKGAGSPSRADHSFSHSPGGATCVQTR